MTLDQALAQYDAALTAAEEAYQAAVRALGPLHSHSH